MGLFGDDIRDTIIADLREENAELKFKLLALVDQRAAALTLARERQQAKIRKQAEEMPRLPDMIQLADVPGPAPFESDEAMEAAFRGEK